MIEHFLQTKITEQLPFQPTEQQAELIAGLASYLTNTTPRRVFLLKGYAGTGKTSVISALVKALKQMERKTMLLAPTGRAAKVLSAYAGQAAYTIHKKIYRCRAFGDYRFSLSENLHTDTLFIVDESSMIANGGGENSGFGSGRLLDDLISYVYSGQRCTLILLGDNAQLPPVMQENSPAMSREWLEGYGLQVHEYELTQVVRQAMQSGILHNATLLRQAIAENDTHHPFPFRTEGFSDIRHLSGQDIIDELQRSYDQVGMEETIVVTRTNKRANLYNQGIRNRILYKEEEISNNDLIMVTRNNYFWTKPYDGIDFLANGDMLTINRIRKHQSLYDCHFVDVSLQALDYDWEIDATLLLDALHTESPDKGYELSNHLFQAVGEDYPEVTNKRKLIELIKENPYYNALQVKFAYAVTCHKAQGGQWKRVFIDQGLLSDDRIDTSYYRWLYTALTRATEQVYLINFEKKK